MVRDSIVISLIIPVYNVAPYLKRCLDSCLMQDYKAYEILCIDDGSTDGSGLILDEYCDSNKDIITVIHTENQGVSEARNCGIRNARGKYIWFIDPDDMISEKILGDIIQKISGKDLMLLPYLEIRNDKENVLHRHWSLPAAGEKRTFGEYTTSNTFDKVWNYIVLRSILIENKLLFGKGIVVGEDKAFDFFLSQCIEEWGIYDKEAYYYVIREHSASKGHTQDDSYKKRMIENSYWLARYFQGNIDKCKNKEYSIKAYQEKIKNNRATIINIIQYGNLSYLNEMIIRLKKDKMYPCQMKSLNYGDNMVKKILLSVVNVPILAKIACVLFGLKKRLTI